MFDLTLFVSIFIRIVSLIGKCTVVVVCVCTIFFHPKTKSTYWMEKQMLERFGRTPRWLPL